MGTNFFDPLVYFSGPLKIGDPRKKVKSNFKLYGRVIAQMKGIKKWNQNTI